MRPPARLLAKSTLSPLSPDPHESFAGHLLESAEVARHLAESRGGAFLTSMGLDPGRWAKALQDAVTRGAYLHDFGKANHQFQRMVLRQSASPQALRHELLSLHLALGWTPLSGWVFSDGFDGVVRYASLFAVAGHHLKFEAPLDLDPRRGSGDATLVLFTGHQDVADALDRGRVFFGLDGHPVSAGEDTELDLIGDPMRDVRRWLVGEAMPWWESRGAEARRFVALAKSMVVAADLVASIVARRGDDPCAWADQVLGRVCSPDDLQRIVERKLEGGRARAFQEKAARSRARVTFVRAGCGTGKTAAAYLWAKERARGRKVFVCYPTTGTATQGYEDYIPSDLEVDARLIHSRAEADIEAMRTAGGDEPDRLLPAVKHDALAAWDAPLVLATADTVLGLTQNNRRGLFSFPAIAEGAFVFDEVHSYDGRLFGALLRFLEAFPGSPALLMTASLQRGRLARIRDALGALGEGLEVVDGPAELERLKRYRLVEPASAPPWDQVEKTLRGGGKVLWVANTVERARGFAREARSRVDASVPLRLYHSRYRYMDRVVRHREVVDLFRSEGPAMAVTTQVCEVSLDISANMLVTDLAPIPALIQRIGRVNRRAKGDSPAHGTVAVLRQAGSPAPYAGRELELALKWYEQLRTSLPGSLASEADLSAAFERFEDADDETGDDVASAWLDGGPFSRPAPLRDMSCTVSVVMEEDREACLRGGRVIGAEVIRRSIPLLFGPVAGEVAGWDRLNGSFVAPRGRVSYSRETGGEWTKG